MSWSAIWALHASFWLASAMAAADRKAVAGMSVFGLAFAAISLVCFLLGK